MTMNLQTRLFPWVTLALIIAVVLLVWMFFENGNTKDTFQRDRQIAAEANAKLRADQAKDSIEIAQERLKRKEDSVKAVAREVDYKSKEKGFLATIRNLRTVRNELGIVIDTTTAKIEKEYQDQRVRDYTEIIALQTDKTKIFTSMSRELSIVGKQNIKLDSAYTAQFTRAQEQSVKLEKVTSQRNKVTLIAILEAAVIVLMIIL
jgi:hypothetical protein